LDRKSRCLFDRNTRENQFSGDAKRTSGLDLSRTKRLIFQQDLPLYRRRRKFLKPLKRPADPGRKIDLPAQVHPGAAATTAEGRAGHRHVLAADKKTGVAVVIDKMVHREHVHVTAIDEVRGREVSLVMRLAKRRLDVFVEPVLPGHDPDHRAGAGRYREILRDAQQDRRPQPQRAQPGVDGSPAGHGVAGINDARLRRSAEEHLGPDAVATTMVRRIRQFNRPVGTGRDLETKDRIGDRRRHLPVVFQVDRQDRYAAFKTDPHPAPIPEIIAVSHFDARDHPRAAAALFGGRERRRAVHRQRRAIVLPGILVSPIGRVSLRVRKIILPHITVVVDALGRMVGDLERPAHLEIAMDVQSPDHPETKIVGPIAGPIDLTDGQREQRLLSPDKWILLGRRGQRHAGQGDPKESRPHRQGFCKIL